MLFDEKTSDSRYKNRVAYVVAHGKGVFDLHLAATAVLIIYS